MTYKETKRLGIICVIFATMSFTAALIGLIIVSAPLIFRVLFCLIMLLSDSHWLWMSGQVWEEFNKSEYERVESILNKRGLSLTLDEK